MLTHMKNYLLKAVRNFQNSEQVYLQLYVFRTRNVLNVRYARPTVSAAHEFKEAKRLLENRPVDRSKLLQCQSASATASQLWQGTNEN